MRARTSAPAAENRTGEAVEPHGRRLWHLHARPPARRSQKPGRAALVQVGPGERHPCLHRRRGRQAAHPHAPAPPWGQRPARPGYGDHRAGKAVGPWREGRMGATASRRRPAQKVDTVKRTLL